MTKVKLFKDASQGYINLYDRYVTHLIDTFEMQRLKDVAQTGMRPIFSGATHDRFSHSLGVFNNAVKMYNAFSSNLVAGLSKEEVDFVENVKKRLQIYKEYYLIACVLHDIGHPAYSHTFEYLYNDNTVLLQESETTQDIDNITIKIDRKELERIVQLSKKSPEKESELQKNLSKSIKDFYNNLKSKEEETWGFYCHPDTKVDESTISGQPHEMMGAYQILRSGKIKEAVTNTFHDFSSENPDIKADLDQGVDLAFLSCMIIGAKYINVGHRQIEIKKDPKNCFKWDASLRNCIIELLNGLMDADSIDYLNRNSHFAGYSTSTLDVTRLTNAFSAYYDSKKGTFISCLEKSALSVMEGFIQARNYEPKWLYSHHKIVYCSEFLFKYLFKKCSRYIFARDEEKWNKLICEYYKEIIPGDPNIQPYIQKHSGSLPDPDNSLKNERDLLREAVNNLISKKLSEVGSADQVNAYLETKPDEEDALFVSVPGKQLLDKIAELSDSFNSTGEVEKLCGGLLKLVNLEVVGLSGTKNKIALNSFFQLASSVVGYVDEIDNLLAKIKNAYLGYIISPVARFEQNTVNGDIYYKATDPDVASIFKKAYLRYRNLSYDELDSAEKRIGQEWEYPFFQDALKEFQTHEYRQSLWKSVEEYTLFLAQISLSTGLAKDTISDFLVKKLIPGGGKIDFEDPGATYRSENRYEINGIFINIPNCNTDKDFDKVFRVFGNGLIIRITSQKFKSFNKLRIHFGNDILCGKENNGIVYYSDISDQKVPPKKWIPYIYYKFDDLKEEVSRQLGEETWGKLSYSEQKSEVRKYLLETLKTGVEEVIIKKMNKEVRVYDGKMLFSDGNIIRDPVHGDIYIPKKFMDIIDTRVFQRLRRIKQLATADYVFPDAGHTRFSHSVGTFHVMHLILERFTGLFDYLGIEYTTEEIDAALAAALLHDIGHGPYSHVFEHIYGKSGKNNKTHEEWSKDIILNDKELNHVFTKNWDEAFNLKVLDCLKCESGSPSDFKLKDVYASLISSQLDADRIDYLMRDSYHTGVTFGSFDLQRLISSMLLSENNGKICVCFDESAVPIIEQFITGRYNMYSEVYYSPYKVFSEELLRKVVLRIVEEPNSPEEEPVLSEILEGTISLEHYLKLDDGSFMREIQKRVDSSNNEILAAMLESLSYRTGFKRLHILDDSFEDTEYFLQDFKEIYGVSLEDFCGVICIKLHFDAYSTAISPDDNINNVCISLKNAGLTAFENISRLFLRDRKQKKLWDTDRFYLYYNTEILNKEWKEQSLALSEESFKSFIKQYSIRNHTEIENKYWCGKEDLEKCEGILKRIVDKSESNFEDFIADDSKGTLKLHDEYYDTNDLKLFKEGLAIRLRSQEGKNTIVTVKKSGISDFGYDNGQFIRSEYEYETKETGIRNEKIESFIRKSIRNIYINSSGSDIDFNQLRKKIEIDNNRTIFTVKRKESEFECVVNLDKICCKETGTEKTSDNYQLEIELNSPDPMERIELRSFSEKLIKEAGISSLEAEESKYGKALKDFNLL